MTMRLAGRAPAALAATAQADAGDGLFNVMVWAIILTILLVGPGVAVGYYKYYRNAGARHRHETETRAEMAGLKVEHWYLARTNDSPAPEIPGANWKKGRGAPGPGA